LQLILKKIAKELSTLTDINLIILYGSFARGDQGGNSDIDLFIRTSRNESAEVIQNKVIELEKQAGRPIQPTIRTAKELTSMDSGLLRNILMEGKILFLREPVDIPATVILKQKPFVIYTFNLGGLRQNVKAKFNRELYAQKNKKYSYQGLLHELEGRKLSAGCVIVPFASKFRLEKFLKKHKITFEALHVWK